MLIQRLSLVLTFALAACDQAPPPLESEASSASIIAWGRPTAVTQLGAGLNNDVPIENGSIHLAAHASGSTVTGFYDNWAQVHPGNAITLINVSTTLPITLAHEHPNADPEMGMSFPSGEDFVLQPLEAIAILYIPEQFNGFFPVVLPPPAPTPPTPPYVEPELVVTTPARAFGAAFQLSTTRPTEVHYSARIDSTMSLTGGQVGRVDLLSDASNPPTTVRARVAGGATGTLSLGLSVTDTTEGELSYTVPAGHYVLLQAVDEVGAPTQTITAQVETRL